MRIGIVLADDQQIGDFYTRVVLDEECLVVSFEDPKMLERMLDLSGDSGATISLLEIPNEDEETT